MPKKRIEKGMHWSKEKAYRVFLLLDIQHGAIFELPFDYIRLGTCSLDKVRPLKLAPEDMEVLQFDEMPDMGKVSGNDGGFGD